MAHVEDVEFVPQENYLILNRSRNNYINKFRETNSSLRTKSLTLFLPPNSISSKNVTVIVSKIFLSVGS